MMFMPDPNFFPSLIPDPDPGVKKAQDPGSGSATMVKVKTNFHKIVVSVFLL
jgi:hypothetical protein